jgi:DNA helicase HerA-like ATPase
VDQGLAGLKPGYTFDGPVMALGRAIRSDEVDTDFEVGLPLSMLNRHGLVAGASGTGKTRTIQGLAGRLSDAGVPCFLADLKGDVSGMAEAGEADDPLNARIEQLEVRFRPHGVPVELLTLSGDAARGVPLRTAVSSFGAPLLAKVLGLNDTQSSDLGLVFHFADVNGLLLVGLKDLRAVLEYLGTDRGQAEVADLGGVSTATLGLLLRKLVELEQQGVDKLFGEPSFDVGDLLRRDPDGKGMVSVLELGGMGDRPRVFSTFMLWLLAELLETLPGVGDLDQPRLVFFFDEAHLLFDDASKEFIDQVRRMVRLIRSKGVGVFFISQLPEDLPDEVLAQLGHRVQHALRAVTARDAAAIRRTADTFPASTLYDVATALTSLAAGEALVTVLSPRGVPAPVAWTRLYPPESMMAPASPQTIRELLVGSRLQGNYAHEVDPESAYELLAERMREAEGPAARPAEADEAATAAAGRAGRGAGRAGRGAARRGRAPGDGDQTEQLMEFGKAAMRFMRTPAGRQVQRSLLGVLRRR